MKPTVAVTGAHGYVGSLVVRELERRSYRVSRLSSTPRLGGTDIPYRLADGPLPGSLVGIDTLIHCAYDFSLRKWSDIERTNVHGSSNLFGAAKREGVKRIVFVSSMSAFEGCTSMYGRAKLATECLTQTLGGVVVRPGLVYSETPARIFSKLVRLARLPIAPVIGRGRQLIHLVHGEDLASAIIEVLTMDTTNTFVFAHPEALTIREILRILGGSRPVLPIPAGLALFGLRALERCRVRIAFSSDSLVSLLSLTPELDFGPTRQLTTTFRSFREAAPQFEEPC